MLDFTQFQKPQRYIGNEYNVIKKPHSGKITICLSYPDLYEVGMSNLGLRLLYGVFNQFNDVVCERVFMPGADLAQYLQHENKKLFSLETKTPLDNFDILGFNFSYPLNFVNFLHILNLGGVPLKAINRRQNLVLGGGIDNPEPLAEFVDVFFLGEFEEAAAGFVDVVKKYEDKETKLAALSEIEGFYIPKFYSVNRHNNKYEWTKTYSYAKLPIKRVYVNNLDNSFYPLKWLTPHTQIVHDRIPVEIARGCPNQCVFCQARAIYRPYRQRSVTAVRKIVEETYRCSGYENFSLLSLSSADYSRIEELIDYVLPFFRDRNIGLALPSLRVDDILGRLYEKLNKIKKTSLTIAIETANNALREKLNKHIDINKLWEALKIIQALKLRHIKTYFMFGLPYETADDLSAVSDFLMKLRDSFRFSLNVSINAFMPKPFSLWQNMPMQEENILAEKKRFILKNLRLNKNLRVFISNPKKSILEAVICRAGREFSSIIYRVFNKDKDFSSYDEITFLKLWYEAMAEENIDYRIYLDAATDNFPWSFIQGAEDRGQRSDDKGRYAYTKISCPN